MVSALSLVLADVNYSMQNMDQALLQLANTPSFTENYGSSAANEFLNLPEVRSLPPLVCYVFPRGFPSHYDELFDLLEYIVPVCRAAFSLRLTFLES